MAATDTPVRGKSRPESRREDLVDLAVQGFSLSLGLAASAWIITASDLRAPGAATLICLLVYLTGLVGTLAVSFFYHLARPGALKARLRTIDRAMIFFLIAGTYTPLCVLVLASPIGPSILIGVWVLGSLGVWLALFRPHRFERASLVLYLACGWLMILAVVPLYQALPSAAFWLIVTGGFAFTFGTVIHLRKDMPFYSALWHLLVLLGVGQHFAAIAIALSALA